MRAIILAAGEGTRLRPHTRERPKCLIEFGGVPLLHRQLAALEACGVEDVTFVTGYCAKALAGLGYPTRHNPDYDHTNMVWSLMCAADLLDGSDDVLISYGDIVYEPPGPSRALGVSRHPRYLRRSTLAEAVGTTNG